MVFSCCATAFAQSQPAPSASTQPTSQPAATQPARNGFGPRLAPVDPNVVTVYPDITNISSVVTPNPNKGWSLYSWGRMPTGIVPEALEAASIVYLRPDWADLEVTEGNFNWELIDGHLRESAAMGKKLAIRVMGTNPSSQRQNTFPKWIMDGYEDQFEATTFDIDGRTKTQIYPKDPGHSPRWKYAVQHLVKELGARYDGNPNLAFVEVGTIGDWGEQISNYAKSNQMLDQMSWREHLGWYKEAFKHTPLMSVTAGQHNMQYGWADENGFGRRSDGFCAPTADDTTNGGYQDGRQIEKAFGYKLPSFLEFPPGSSPSGAGRDFTWGKFWKGLLVLGRPTYVGYNYGNAVPNMLDKDYPYRLIEAANRMGYHLVAERVSYPLDLFSKGEGKVSITFRNDGCKYPDYPIYVACAALDADNNVVQIMWCDSIDLRANAGPWVSYAMTDELSGHFVLPVPKTYEASASLKMDPTGKATRLAMGLFTSKTLTDPDIQLGNTGRLTNGWYPLDQYSITPQEDPYPSMHNLAFKAMAITSATGKGDISALTDGNDTTLWSSPATSGQWVVIDLGSARKFSSIMLDWGGKGAASYTVESSQNGASWTNLCEVANGDGGKDYLPLPSNTESRYIRLSSKNDAGISLYEFQALGSEQAERPARRMRRN